MKAAPDRNSLHLIYTNTMTIEAFHKNCLNKNTGLLINSVSKVILLD